MDNLEKSLQRPKPPILVPMTEKDMENAIRTIAEAFGTDEDPEQAPPSVEQFKGLQNIDPYSLLLIKDDDGKITGWSGLVPTSSKLGDEFVAGRKNENQVIAEAIADPKYEAMYLWAFYMHPDHRRKGDSLRLIEAQFKHIMERHPTIQKYYSWGYSPEGAKILERLEGDLGIKVEKSPNSY